MARPQSTGTPQWNPTAAQKEVFQEWKLNTIQHLVSCKMGIQPFTLPGMLKAVTDERVPLDKMGLEYPHRNINAFLYEMRDALEVRKFDNKLYVFVKESSVPAALQHIRRMVLGQKGKADRPLRHHGIPVPATDLLRYGTTRPDPAPQQARPFTDYRSRNNSIPRPSNNFNQGRIHNQNQSRPVWRAPGTGPRFPDTPSTNSRPMPGPSTPASRPTPTPKFPFKPNPSLQKRHIPERVQKENSRPAPTPSTSNTSKPAPTKPVISTPVASPTPKLFPKPVLSLPKPLTPKTDFTPPRTKPIPQQNVGSLRSEPAVEANIIMHIQLPDEGRKIIPEATRNGLGHNSPVAQPMNLISENITSAKEEPKSVSDLNDPERNSGILYGYSLDTNRGLQGPYKTLPKPFPRKCFVAPVHIYNFKCVDMLPPYLVESSTSLRTFLKETGRLEKFMNSL